MNVRLRARHGASGSAGAPAAAADAAVPGANAPGTHTARLRASAVVCTYTEARWADLVRAVASLLAQDTPPDQVVLVVDHNSGLLARARREFTSAVEVITNDQHRGLAGARNAGVHAAWGDVVAFLDDDAVAESGWLRTMVTHFADPDVVGVGGAAVAVWPTERRPRRLPAEFDWVVGCTHRGLPDAVAPVRNPVGASMALRRNLFDVVGGFDTAMGRVGRIPLGCEETELAVRVRQRISGASFIHDPDAVALHYVSPDRVRVGYFVRRCFAEGLSKAALARRAGSQDALSSERRYSTVTLPRAALSSLGAVFTGDVSGLARAVVIVLGVATAATGYVVGWGRARLARTPSPVRVKP